MIKYYGVKNSPDSSSQIFLPANTKTPINHITPIKTIAPGSSWPGLGFFPILTAVLSPT